jgi:transcriptional regulator with XRE-family HTH domain
MAHLGDRSCPDCGIQPRRNHDCTGVSDLALPANFYDDPGLSAALARGDFGPVLRRVRGETCWSQHVLGALLGLDQATISKIENGKRSLTDAATVIKCANVLRIPAGKLGFRYGVTVEDEARSGQKGSWVERRDFVGHVAGLTLGAGATGLDINRLLSLLPQAEPTGTRHVGVADVEAIEQATTALVRQDFAHGSGRARDTAVTQLHSTLPLLGAQVSPEVRPRLYLATARLATQAGYMSFDSKKDDAARRLWMIGLDIARNADHPLGTDQTLFLLYDMAIQAVHLQRPDEALKLVHLGHAAATGSPAVSAATTICLASIQAQAHAARGDAAGCDRALGQGIEQFSSTDPASDDAWAADLIDETRLAAYQGAAHYRLALASGDPHAAGRAVSLLRHSVDCFGVDHGRARALYLPDLAGAHALAGDLDAAVSVGHKAVDVVTSVHSARAYDRLHQLHTVLEPLHTSPGVAELRDRLTTTAA